jgi:hypothetical protein
MIEEWKAISGYDGIYEISSFGRVKSLSRVVYYGKRSRITKSIIMKPSSHRQGYELVSLSINNKRKTFLVSRLVAFEFISNPRELKEVNHIDGNKENNRVDNLEWVTAKENVNHSFRIGLHKSRRGEGNSNSKLSLKNVIEIRKMLKNKTKHSAIAKKYQISKSLVGQIGRNIIWIDNTQNPRDN